MRKGLKRFLIIISMVIVLVGLYAYACIIFTPKDETDFLGPRYYNYANFKSEAKNSLDMVMFGDSDAYAGYIPLELYRQAGATSYVRAGPNESMVVVEKNIEETYKRQNPKLIVLEANCLFNANTSTQGTHIQKFIPYIAPFACHARWKELTWKDFVTIAKPHQSLLKGHTFNTKVYDYKKPQNYMEDLDAKPEKIQKSVLKSFKNIVNICKKHDAELLLVCFPSPCSWSNAKNNAVVKLTKKYGVPFIDFNMPLENFEFDYSSYFFDEGNHLNNRGATVATNYLIKYFEKCYNLPDHRNDDAYKSWDDCLKYYDDLKKGENDLAV